MMTDVLVLFEYPSLNGGERSYLSVLGKIREAGVNISAACPELGALADELRTREVPIQPLRLRDPKRGRRSQDEIRDDLLAIIQQQSPHLIHANSLSMSRLCGPVAKQAGVPSIGHLRDIVRLSATAINDVNCNSRLLAVSEATRKWHVEAGLDADKTFVLYNGVHLDQFQPRQPTKFLHDELSLPDDAKLVASIGQIGLRKGLDVLLQAAAEVVIRQPRSHFVIVGERFSDKQESRDFEATLRQSAANGPLAGHVHFLGWREDVLRILNEVTLLVHPSRQEPFGRVLLEAAAAGVALVATDVGGTREMFPDAGQARLVKPDDPIALAQATIEVLSDNALRDRIARAARDRVAQQFSAESSAASLIEHYRAVI